MGRVAWGIFFAVVFFLLLMYRLPVEIERAGYNVSFHFVGILVFAVLLSVRVNLYGGLFLGWAAVSSILAALLYSGGKILHTHQSMSALFAMMIGCAIYAAIVLIGPDDHWILNMICFSLMLHLLTQTSQALKGVPATGIMWNPNGASAFTALCSVGFYRPGWRYLWVVPVVSLMFAKSFGGVFASGLVLIAWGYLHGYWALSGIVVVIGLGLYTVLIDTPGTVRAEVWEFVVPWTFRNHWITGTGPGNWKVFFAKLYSEGILVNMSWIRIHSTWIEGFVEMGVPFVVLIAGFFIDTIRRFKKSATIPMLGLVAILGVGCANSFFKFNQLNGALAILWLGLLEVRLREA